MLSIIYLLLWQLLSLVLSLLVFNQFRNMRQFILPAIILLQLIQLWYTQFANTEWVNSAAAKLLILSVQVAGYGLLLIRYITIRFVSRFTKLLVWLQALLILFAVVPGSSSIAQLYPAMILLNAVAILIPAACVLYLMMKYPPHPFQSNSFPPIVWVAIGVIFYFVSTCFIQVSTICLSASTSSPDMMGWFEMIRIVQHVVMYVFFTVAFVICLRQQHQFL